MYQRRKILVVLLAMVLSVLAVGYSEAAKGKTPKTGKVEGTLFGVASNGVVIKVQGGALVSLSVNSATKVELNNRRVPVTSLPVGAKAQALFDPDTRVASKVEAVK